MWERFAESKEYRENFVAAFAKKSIPSQIRAWMKKEGITTQRELANRSGITQGVISRAVNPNYGDLTLNTIINIGSGLDCVFVGRYVPFSEFCKMVIEDSFAEDADTMLSFEQENERLKERRKAEQVQALAAGSEHKDISEGQKWMNEKTAVGLGGPIPKLASKKEKASSNDKMSNEPYPTKRPQADMAQSKEKAA